MTSLRTPSRLRAAALLAVLALISGCGDSPTGPKPVGPGILAPGVLASGTITSLRDTARYDLNLSEGKSVVIYFLVRGAQLRLEVHDAGGNPITATSDANNPGLPERRFTTIIPASPSHYRVDVSSVYSDVASDYEIRVVAASSAPEHVPATLDVGTTVSGEDLGHRWDVDSFVVNPTTSQLVSLYARKTKSGPATLFIEAFDANQRYNEIDLGVAATDTVLGTASSAVFSLAAGTHWVVRVGYGAIAPDSGVTPYELQLQTINPAPESAAAALVPGDTVSESIDYPRDFDVFTLTGAPGARFNVFAEALGAAPHAVAVDVEGLDGGGAWVSVPAGHPLGEGATGVFALPASGKATVTVYGSTSAGGVGPVDSYHLLAYPIDPRPEGTTAAIALDETKASQLEMLGDVDEYSLTIPRDTVVDIAVRGVSTLGRPIVFTLLDARDSVLVRRERGAGSYPYIDGDSAGMGSTLLPAGTYKVRVEGMYSAAGGHGYTGPYEVLPRTVNTAPETRSATIVPGDTVRGESIDPAGDIDRYRMTLVAGDSVYFGIEPPSSTYLVNVTLSTSQWDMPERLFVAPRDGDYYITVSGMQGGVNLAERISYGLHLVRAGLAPEDRPAAFALGDTVRSRIDVSGEADEFLASAPAGATLTGSLSFAGSGGPNVWAVFVDPATGVHFDSALVVHGNVGDVTVPASGALRVRIVGVAPCGGYVPCIDPGPTGPYAFSLHVLDRGPETGSAAYTVGDTVSETIDRADIDEYHFDGTAGDTVSVYFQLQGQYNVYGGLLISLIDLTTGATLGSTANDTGGARLEDVAIPNVVLPSTGSYQVRIQAVDEFEGDGGYRFRVARPR